MTGSVFVTMALLTSCRSESPFESPELGASDGEVRLDPQGALDPETRVTVALEADAHQRLVGGPCFMIFKWSPGFGPSPVWVVDTREAAPRRVGDDGEVTCPAVGSPLPATFTFTMPALDDGTYRITYNWRHADDESAARRTGAEARAEYTFVVDDA